MDWVSQESSSLKILTKFWFGFRIFLNVNQGSSNHKKFPGLWQSIESNASMKREIETHSMFSYMILTMKLNQQKSEQKNDDKKRRKIL